MLMPESIFLTLVGIAAGVTAGLFGVGGGVLIVPGLVYLLGFSQHRAVGTSLAVLLPPVGLAAVVEYYRHGNVDIRAAFYVAIALFVGGYFGAGFANRLSGPILKTAFGVFLIAIGVYTCYTGLSARAKSEKEHTQVSANEIGGFNDVEL